MVVGGPKANRNTYGGTATSTCIDERRSAVMMTLEQVFRECDRDSDGFLSLSELVNFCDRLNNYSSTPSFSLSTPLPPSAIMARNLLGPADWGKKLSFNELYTRLSGTWICDMPDEPVVLRPVAAEGDRDTFIKRQPHPLQQHPITTYQSQRQTQNQNESAINQSITAKLHTHFAEDARLSSCEIVHTSTINSNYLLGAAPLDNSVRLQHHPTSSHFNLTTPPLTPAPRTRHADSSSQSSRMSLDSNSVLLSTPPPVHKGDKGRWVKRWPPLPPCNALSPYMHQHLPSPPLPHDPHAMLSHNLTPSSSSSSSFVAMQQQPPHSCVSSKSDLHKTISMLSVCSQKRGGEPPTYAGIDRGTSSMQKTGENGRMRTRHQSSNNQSAQPPINHRRLNSSSSMKMVTSLQSAEGGIENEAFTLTLTPHSLRNNNAMDNDLYQDQTDSVFGVNSSSSDGGAAGESESLADCSVIERTIREVCESSVAVVGEGTSNLIDGRARCLDYRESQLSEQEQRQLLKHVICTISGRPDSPSRPYPRTRDAQNSQADFEDDDDDDGLNEVVDQVRSLVLAKLHMDHLLKGVGQGKGRERQDVIDDVTVVVTPQKLASALFLVAQGYEQEQLHQQQDSNDVIAADQQQQQQQHITRMTSQSPLESVDNCGSNTAAAHFVPISNQISSMHVLTGPLLESMGVDVGAVNQAQVFKDRGLLEQLLSSLFDRVSQEGIDSDPKVAMCLYLLRIISDFSKEEVEDLEKHVISQQHLFKETVEHFERSQMETDSHIDRINSQHTALIKRMKSAHEVEIERLKKQHEAEKMQMESEHRHELLKLRTQLDRLNSRNCTLKDKIHTYHKETKEQSLTISKLESERKQLLYDRSMLEDTLENSPHLFHDIHLDSLTGGAAVRPNLHHSFLLSPCHSSTAGGPHDNFGAVSSPNSTLRWETCSDGSIERDFLTENNPIMEDDECNSSTGGGGGNRNFKGSTIYLYMEDEKRSHRNSSQSETQNKMSTFELNEDINEEQRNFSAICCSIVQLTRSFRNTRKQKTQKQSKDKTRSTRVASGHDNSSHSAYFSKRVSSSSVRKK